MTDAPQLVQTAFGAHAFVEVRVVYPPSQLHLADGVTVKPTAAGTFILRRADLPPLVDALGLVTIGASTPAAFAANVLAGIGAGVAG